MQDRRTFQLAGLELIIAFSEKTVSTHLIGGEFVAVGLSHVLRLSVVLRFIGETNQLTH